MTVEDVVGRRIASTIDGGRHHPDAALAFAEVLGQPQRGVVGERLAHDALVLHALRDALHAAERQPAREPARDLCRTDDPGWIATDPPGIEQPFPATVHDA